MTANELDIGDIKVFQPLSRAFKKVDKYFKNSTLHELKAKFDRHKSHRDGLMMKELSMDLDAKLPVLKKENKFFIKVNMEKEKKERDLRSQNRAIKIDTIIKKRVIYKQEENNNVFPGKYNLNQSSIASKAIEILNKTENHFKRSTCKAGVSSPNLTIDQSMTKLGSDDKIELNRNQSGQNLDEKIVGKDSNSNNINPIFKKKIKKLNSIDSLKQINGFGYSKRGIKFQLYSSRDMSMFGIFESKLAHKVLDPLDTIKIKAKGERYSHSTENSMFLDKSTLSMRRSQSVIGKRKYNPQMNFKNMLGREDIIKHNNIPDALIYKPNLDAVRASNKHIISFDCKPNYSDKKHLIKKMWSSFNTTKNLQILQIEAYLKNQESNYKLRISKFKQGTLDLKKDF